MATRVLAKRGKHLSAVIVDNHPNATRSTPMTSTVREQESAHLADDGTETVARLTRLDGLHGPLTPAPRKAGGIIPTWSCLEHVPGSTASWVAECLRFGGRRRRREAAKAAYDAIWAGHGVTERGDEPWCAPGVAIESRPPLRQSRPIAATSGGPGA